MLLSLVCLVQALIAFMHASDWNETHQQTEEKLSERHLGRVYRAGVEWLHTRTARALDRLDDRLWTVANDFLERTIRIMRLDDFVSKVSLSLVYVVLRNGPLTLSVCLRAVFRRKSGLYGFSRAKCGANQVRIASLFGCSCFSLTLDVCRTSIRAAAADADLEGSAETSED